MGVGDGGDQAVRALDGHVAVGGQVVGPIDMAGDHPHAGAGGGQIVTFGIAAYRGQQGGGQAEAAQGDGDVHGDAAGEAGDPARHVGGEPHRGGGAADHVPQDGADAKDIWGYHGRGFGDVGGGGQDGDLVQGV